MTEFERRYPGVAMKAKCPKCGKGGKSIRSRETDRGTNYCCGKCGESWYETQVSFGNAPDLKLRHV